MISQSRLFNADRGTRTLTSVSPADFESAASAIPPHPHEPCEKYFNTIMIQLQGLNLFFYPIYFITIVSAICSYVAFFEILKSPTLIFVQ